ncbi:hypothetical protein [Neglectibacter caecimuris]|uniref:hypothetical protein n=1 Tax=Neglectibacter caecimuris TaxID=3093658 RepID=UPI002AC9EE99|nr:hypothetical protein [Neglectibacter sp. M00184]
MAEYCIDCWNKLNKPVPPKPPEQFILSDMPELCEGCGKYRPTVIMERRGYCRHRFRFLQLPGKLMCALWNLITAPYRLRKNRRNGSRRS